MSPRSTIQVVFFSILSLSLICGCAADNPLQPDPGNSSDTQTDTLFRSLSRVPQPDPLSSPITLSNPVTNFNGDYITVTTRYRAAPGFDELICMAPGSDTLWPGALVYGDSVGNGEYLPIITPRAPLTFSVSLVNIQGSRTKTVNTPSLSTMRQAIGDLLTQNVTGSTPARTAFSISDVYSEEQLQLAVGGNFGAGVFSVKSQFDFSDTAIRSRVLVKFAQVYYTIDIDLPQNPSDFFTTDSTISNIHTQSRGVSPLYVSSISYGRLALFSFESQDSREEVKSALSAAFNGLTAKGEITLTHRQQEVLRNSIIKATIIGGNGGMAVHSINGIEGLKAFVLMGGNYDRDNPGAPLAYRFRYLSDNATCRIVFASEYEVTRTWVASRRFRVYEMTLHCVTENDAGEEEELYGWCRVRCKTGDTFLPGYWDGTGANELIWNTGSNHPWRLKKGQSRPFAGGRDFSVPIGSLETAVLQISAHIKEEDTFSDDDLGKRTMEIPVQDLVEGSFSLTGFKNGGTRVQINFRARPL